MPHDYHPAPAAKPRSQGDEVAPATGSNRSLGSKLARFLYPRPARRSVGGIFKWWERRRLAFSLIVGAGGGASLLAHGALGWLEGDDPILLPALFWLLAVANVCYTLGPVTESILHRIWGRDVLPVGPHLFRAGLALSVGVTFLLPMLLFGVRAAVTLVRSVLGVGLA